MITVVMPDRRELRFEHVVFDYNGTLAVDGVLAGEVKARLVQLSKLVHTVIITADTFGLAASQLADVPGVELVILTADRGTEEKADFAGRLGQNVIVVGNGANDCGMFRAATAICVVGREGAFGKAVASADIVVTRPEDALDLLLNSKRLVATLRR